MKLKRGVGLKVLTLWLLVFVYNYIDLAVAWKKPTMMGEHLTPADFEAAARLVPIPYDHGFISKGGLNDILRPKTNTRTDVSQPWPNGVVPYLIDSEFSAEERAVIAKSVTAFHEVSCVRVVARTTETDYVVVRKDSGISCGSRLGYQGGQQLLLLAHRCCLVPGSVVHEFMHALGFQHEHTRTDRDDFVRVFYENISNKGKPNFIKSNTPANMESPYDINSITHYGNSSFSINHKPTMLPKNGAGELGQRVNLTKYDIQKINGFYKCTGKRPEGHNLENVFKNSATPVNGSGGAAKPEPQIRALFGLNCVDFDPVYCKHWSKHGHCSKSPLFMAAFCRVSCKQCELPCRDLNKSCTKWVKKLYCSKYADYMRLYCQKSCKVCI